MNIPLPGNEWRWRCKACGEDCPDERRHVSLADPISTNGGWALGRWLPEGVGWFSAPSEEPVPFSGPLERAHVIVSYSGGRSGMIGSAQRHKRICGPLRWTEIDIQELFLRFGEKTVR